MHPRTLKRARKALGLTQEATAICLGVTRNTVERWERGVHPIPLWVYNSVKVGVLALHASIVEGSKR